MNIDWKRYTADKYNRYVFVSCVLLLLPFVIVSDQFSFGFILFFMLMLAGIAMISRLFLVVSFIPLLIVNTYYLHIENKWGTEGLGSRVEVSFQSASYEMAEYLYSYTDYFDAGIIFQVLVVLLLLGICLKQSRSDINRRSNVYAGVALALVSASVLIVNYRYELKIFPAVDIPYEAMSAISRIQKVSGRKEMLSKKIDQVQCESQYRKVVIVLGESALKDRLSVYGYEKPTTPFLDSINALALDAVSPANQTRYSIPIMLTKASVQRYDDFYAEKSLVTKLKECGYGTYWISNQGQFGKHETSITSIAKEADQAHFLNAGYVDAGFDEKVVKALKKIDIKEDQKQAFFIHILGSHQAYASRYPETKGYFKGSDIGSKYDNSIYYTDYVLSEIYKYFETNDRLLFIYVADHGEVVSDELSGHGFSQSYKEEYRAPLVLWSTESDRFSMVAGVNEKGVINADAFSEIVEYLVGHKADLEVSYSDTVISLSPKNQKQYSKLKSIGD